MRAIIGGLALCASLFASFEVGAAPKQYYAEADRFIVEANRETQRSGHGSAAWHREGDIIVLEAYLQPDGLAEWQRNPEGMKQLFRQRMNHIVCGGEDTAIWIRRGFSFLGQMYRPNDKWSLFTVPITSC